MRGGWKTVVTRAEGFLGGRVKQPIVLILALFMAVIGPLPADAANYLQENLIDLPNRFAVTISAFADDNGLTPQSVRALVETQLTDAGFKLAPERSAPPLATIQVMVVRHEDPVEGAVYLLDLNVYNVSTLRTTYRLRKGTIWMMGTEKVAAGEGFRGNVEERLSRMLRYLTQDYFAVNPGEAKQ